MGEPPQEGPCIPVGCRGTWPPSPQGRGGTQYHTTLRAIKEMPEGEIPACSNFRRPKHAGGWTGPAGLHCQIARMQAGTHPKGVLAAGRSLKSLGSNPLSLFISSEHEAELGTEVPGTEGTRRVAALAPAKASCPLAQDAP